LTEYITLAEKVAHHRELDRQEILEAFEDIPVLIAMAHTKLATITNEKALHAAVYNLKLTLFECIPKLLGILKPRTFSGR